MRILFLMRDALPPFRADVQALFSKYLPQLGIFSDIMGQVDPDYTGDVSWIAGKAIVAGAEHKGIFAEFIRPLRDVVALLCYREAYDLIQVRDKIRSAAFAWAYAKWHKKPFVYWMSFPFVEGFEITARNRKQAGIIMKLADYIRINASRYVFYTWVLPKADHIFVQSEAMRGWLINKGYAAQRMTAVPMGVDTEQFQRDHIVPSDDLRLQGKRSIIYVGSLSKPRHSDFLLELITALKVCEPNILLVLAGDAVSTEERLWIREEIKQRNLEDDVLLTGWLSQEQILRYAVSAEIGLSPIPRSELYDVSSPTKLVEYLALGLPGVANDIPDQKLVIEQSQAGICVPMEINAFRDAVLKLLNDAAFYRQCKENGPIFIKKERAYAMIAQRVAHTYQTILANQS